MRNCIEWNSDVRGWCVGVLNPAKDGFDELLYGATREESQGWSRNDEVEHLSEGAPFAVTRYLDSWAEDLLESAPEACSKGRADMRQDFVA